MPGRQHPDQLFGGGQPPVSKCQDIRFEWTNSRGCATEAVPRRGFAPKQPPDIAVKMMFDWLGDRFEDDRLRKATRLVEQEEGEMGRVVLVSSRDDILPAYRGTPIEALLGYHNLAAPPRDYSRAPLLIGMCMDHRTRLRIPLNFAYIVRAAGANFRGREFQISFAVALGGVRAICLIGHDQCGMVGLASRREEFVEGLIEHGGWNRLAAEEQFDSQISLFEIRESAEFVRSDAARLRGIYPKLIVAPLLFSVENGMLYQITERGDRR